MIASRIHMTGVSTISHIVPKQLIVSLFTLVPSQ